MQRTTVVLFRANLRCDDNPALAAAAATGGAVVPLYVLDDTVRDWQPGGASRWWLHHSLEALAADLRKRGSRLILRRGDPVAASLDVAREAGATAIHITRDYGAAAMTAERLLHKNARAAGIDVRRFSGALLREPEEMLKGDGTPYRVFTPFWNALRGAGVRTPVAAPEQLAAPEQWPDSDTLAGWQLLPAAPDWANGFTQLWRPGSEGARTRITDFLERSVHTYGTRRDFPAIEGTSRLSPHLHSGDISAARCWQIAAHALERDPSLAAGAEVFLRELAWREFSYHLLHHFPTMPDAPLRPEFARFPWQRNTRTHATRLRAWQRGRTGYPIVDAGMRELWHTGWMHNRVRMITASFLTKHLLIPWQEGERWFWDTLVDADLAANSASWQWVAGCGADAAPYFRIFNPTLQGKKFDADGAYVRRWVPEIAKLPDDMLHEPASAPALRLRAAGVELGKTYPKPIVDHSEARTRAMAAYQAIAGKTADLGREDAGRD